MSYGRSTESPVAQLRAVERAEARARPLVGPVVGCDSAEEVYREALRRLGHDVSTLFGGRNAEAAFDMASGATTRRVAMDSQSAAAREARFPNANRLGNGF